jgi:membrane fusion protein, heavy metal efflux system
MQPYIVTKNSYKNYLLAIAYCVLLVACGSKKAAESVAETNETSENIVTLTEAQLQNADLEIGKLEQRNISSTLKVNGQIDVPPQNLVSVSMPLGGYLKTTKLLPGMHVRKGEIIATLEDQQYIQLQQDYLMVKSKIAFTELEMQRQRELNASKASSDKVTQLAELEYNTQKIILAALSEKLKLININPQNLSENNLSKSVNLQSPINGFVSKVAVNIGKYVTPSDVLFELVNPSDIHLNLKIFEKDLRQLAIKQKLVSFTNNQPERKHPCEIILISQNISENHSADVHCHFLDYDKTLLPGMYMNAEIELRNKSCQTLPEEAIVSFEGKNYVFIANNKTQFVMHEVEVGNKENGFVEIKNSETIDNQAIVRKGAYTLLMKSKNKEE